MMPRNLRSSVDVARDVAKLEMTWEVLVPVKLLAEMIRMTAHDRRVGEGHVESCAFALANALIDDRLVARPYKTSFEPLKDAIMGRAREEHIIHNIGTPEASNYPR